MQDEYISLNEFMKRYKIGYNNVLQMINNKEIEAHKTVGGQYKIRITKDSVSREVYEEEHKRRIEAETTIDLLKKILIEAR